MEIDHFSQQSPGELGEAKPPSARSISTFSQAFRQDASGLKEATNAERASEGIQADVAIGRVGVGYMLEADH